MRFHVVWSLVLCSIFAWAACSSKPTPKYLDLGLEVDSEESDLLWQPDSTIIGHQDSFDDPDELNFDGWDGVGFDYEFIPDEGGFLWPCTEAEDCLSSYCINTQKYGQICTILCETECPLNWKCESKTEGPDIIYLCSPPETDLCQTCAENDDCGADADLCIPIGTPGEYYCATSCKEDEECPEEYLCQEVTLEDSSTVKQCIPESGSCICFGKINGTTEPCVRENEWGKCYGERLCDGIDGWTDCSADPPEEEICDGKDNDCNGEKDDNLIPLECSNESTFGICVAMEECLGTEGFVCPAPTPGPDVCDYVDNDCDGLTDEDFEGLGEDCDNPDDDDDCAEGLWQCNIDSGLMDCAGDVPHAEICNGLDDNCDGVIDDPWPEKEQPCDGQDVDKCKNGIWVCDGDYALKCIGDVNQLEVCDGLDNDCNGMSDDGFPDYDFDAIANCVDDDDDGDNVPEDGDESGKNGDLPCDGPDFIIGCDDNCPLLPNPGQLNNDDDDKGDLCDDDDDNDGVKDPIDNCDFTPNPYQEDVDDDGTGDACDADADDDGILNDGDQSGVAGDNPCEPGENDDCDDNCALNFNPIQEDADDDGTGNVCDDDDDNDGVTDDKDCAPFDDTVFPGALEICNGKDDNCDLVADPEGTDGCSLFYIDADDDGFGFAGLSKCVCGEDGTPPYTALDPGDCNDSNKEIHPMAEETCNNFDDNCDGDVDNAGANGCVLRYLDHDQDNYGLFAEKKCVCTSKGEYTAIQSGDCNDDDPDIHPGAKEYCNEIDDNCNYSTDEDGSLGCNTYYIDEDYDGWGVEDFTKCACQPKGVFQAESPGDCDDWDKDIFPGKQEICDGKDNDCDKLLDEKDALGCTVYFLDLDKDGFGNSADNNCYCSPEGFYTATKGGDCDDANPNISVGSSETCNGVDDDCDGIIDEDTLDCTVYFYDDDDDGFGDPNDSLCLCSPGQGYTSLIGGDCDDGLTSVHPGAQEICNNMDDDCDDLIDNDGSVGCSPFYQDIDTDGFGNSFKWKCLCGPTDTFTATQAGDCNDAEAAANPGMNELCDGLDNDCNNKTDESGSDGCILFFLDNDGDDYGITNASQCTCEPEGVYSALLGGDCNDNNFFVNPGMAELCDGSDNNCLGGIDEGFPDLDNDGSKDCLDTDKDGDNDPIGSDCDDLNPAVNKYAKEKCDGSDNNCNGLIDEENALGCQTYYYDNDQDGYGMANQFKCLCEQTGLYNAAQALDCNDDSPIIYPGATEQCNNIDDNCNQSVDEGDPAKMCGAIDQGIPVCSNGTCKIDVCELNYYDLDNVYDNGCECARDGYDLQNEGGTCSTAVNLGSLQPNGGTESASGNLVPGEDEDWFTFIAENAPYLDGCNNFTLTIEMQQGKGAFQFMVLQDGCDVVLDSLCAAGDDFFWSVNFYDGANGGECPCSTELGPPGTNNYSVPGKNYCVTHGGKYYIRVTRVGGVPVNCGEYKLAITNGP